MLCLRSLQIKQTVLLKVFQENIVILIYLFFAGAKIVHEDGDYSFLVLQEDGNSPQVELKSSKLTTEYKERTTSFANVTFDLNKSGPTQVAYLFYGPNITVTSFAFASHDGDVTKIGVGVNKEKYDVRFASLISGLASRMKAFGFGAYASVSVNSGEPVVFGAPKRLRESINRCEDNEEVVRSLVSSRELEAVQNAGKSPYTGFESVLVILCVVFLLITLCRCVVKSGLVKK